MQFHRLGIYTKTMHLGNYLFHHQNTSLRGPLICSYI